MYRILLILLFAAFTANGAELLKIASIQDNTPVFKARPSDPGNVRINDGNLKNFSWWSITPKSPKAELSIQLAGKCKVEKMVLHFYNHAPGKKSGKWQPTSLELLKENPGGVPEPLLVKTAFAPLLKRYDTLTIPMNNVEGDRFTLKMAAVRNLGICEIQFFGTPLAAKVTAADRKKFDAVGKKGLEYRIVDVDDDGKKEYVIGNEKALYIISPAKGGTVDFAMLRSTGKNFIKSRGIESHGGAMGDALRFGNMARVWSLYRSEYSCKVEKSTPDELVLNVQYDYGRSMPGPLVYGKIYTLRKDSPVLQVKTTIFNDGANMVPWDEPFRIHNFFGSGKGDNMLFYTTTAGLQKILMQGEKVVQDLANGTAGVVDSAGDGIALDTDFSNLESFAFWSGRKNKGKSMTIEAMQGKFQVAPDNTWQINSAIIPFTGVKTPHFCGAYGVGEFSFDKNGRLYFNFQPCTPGKYTWQLSGVKARIMHGKGSLKKGRNLLLKEWDGTSVKIEVFRNGQAVGNAFYAGKVSMQIPVAFRKIVPVEKAVEAEVQLDFSDTRVATLPEAPVKDHLKKVPEVWFAGERFYWAREVSEFIRRYGIKAKAFPLGEAWRMGNNVKQLYRNQSEGVFHKAIDSKNPSFDVLAISGSIWKRLSAKRQKHIMDLVKKGKGLFLWGEPLEPFKVGRPEAVEAAGKHLITSGMLQEYMPETYIFRLRKPVTGREVILRSARNKHPLLTVERCGKGRIVRSYWNSRADPFRPEGRYSSSSFSLRMENYYHWVIIPEVKALFWAAGRLPEYEAELTASGGSDGKLLLKAVKAPAGTDSADIRFFDSCGHLLKEQVKGAALKNNAVKTVWPAGSAALNVVLRNKAGKALWWGGVAVEYPGRVKPVLKTDRSFYPVGQDVDLEILNTAGFKGVYRVTLTDSFGRVFGIHNFTGTRNKLPMADALGTAVLIRVDAVGPRGVIAGSAEKYVYPATLPDTDRFMVDIAWMWVNNQGYPKPLLPWFWDALRSIGINVSSHFNVGGIKAPMVKSARESGMPTPTFADRTRIGTPKPGTNEKSKLKTDWVRRACVNDPAFRKSVKNISSQFGEIELAGGTLGRMGPDELNSHAGTWDGCFCVHCQKSFRVWLQKRYGTLEKLNKVWKSSFKSWDEVLGDSLVEARAKKHFVSWIDHREFQEVTQTRGVETIETLVKSKVKNGFFSLSGTQDMTSFRALNWKKLMKHQKGLYSYMRFQTQQQRSFIPAGERIFWLQWLGYNASLSVMTRRMVWHMAMGGNGAAVYSYYYITPDLIPIYAARDLAGAMRLWYDRAGDAMIATYDSRPGVTMLFDARGEKLNYAMERGDLTRGIVTGIDTMASDSSVDWLWRSGDALENSKVIFVPAQETISDELAARLDKFVRQGGSLVMIQATGKADGLGSLRKTPVLDKLLGIDSSKVSYAAGTFRMKSLIPALKGLAICNLRSRSSGVKAISARVIAESDGMPQITCNSVGKGKAWYVGCDLFQIYGKLTTMRKFRQFAPMVRSMQSFMELLDPPRHIKIRDGKNYAIGARSVIRKSGKVLVASVIDFTDPEMEAPTYVCSDTSALPVLTFDAGKKYHMYDLFTGKKLTAGSTFKSRLKYPGGSLLFSMIPYQPRKVEVKASHAGRDIKVKTVSSPHPLDVKVFRNGKQMSAYERVLTVPAGAGERCERSFTFRPGLNEKGGKWTIRVRDLFSDQKGEIQL